jgi:hypothetical protein
VKRDGFQVWRRCRRCGTVFSDPEELRLHLTQHPGSRRQFLPEFDRPLATSGGAKEHNRSDGEPARITDRPRDVIPAR